MPSSPVTASAISTARVSSMNAASVLPVTMTRAPLTGLTLPSPVERWIGTVDVEPRAKAGRLREVLAPAE